MADPIRDFALDADDDMAVANGDRTVVSGQAAVAQACKIKVKLFLGEIYLDQSLGVDYLGVVLVKNPDPVVVREAIRVRLQSVADVTEVVGAQLVRDDPNDPRSASITYSIRTKYSQTPITDTVSA
jgi:hypothetical protein